MIQLSPHLIAIVIILILFLMWTLNLLLYRPILKALDERKEIVDGAVEDTENAQNNIQNLQQEYDHAVREARKDAKAVYNKNHEEALSREKEILAEAHKKAEGVIEKAMTQLDKEIDSAKDELQSHAETLSREIGAKILGRAF